MFFVNIWVNGVIETLSVVEVDITIDLESGIGVEVLSGVNTNVFVAVMTAL